MRKNKATASVRHGAARVRPEAARHGLRRLRPPADSSFHRVKKADISYVVISALGVALLLAAGSLLYQLREFHAGGIVLEA
ncbi:MAG TPA: hypothetical protein PLL10_07120, partial [Elusimicrobiales bacterium]|nr:hypothetical protein [Elusimicrobiales bacterium]